MSLKIGIDLGTTNSLVAYEKKGRIKIVKFGNSEMLKSALYYEKNEITIGEKAKQRGRISPSNLITSSKTFMGDITQKWQIEDRTFTPTDVASEILKKLKEKVTKKSKSKSEEVEAVITVPAYFTSNQIDETKIAGENAGLIIKRIITEPVAAAIAYADDLSEDEKIFVIDLGGGTFDVSILETSNNQNIFDTIAVAGDKKLGGDNFTESIFKMLIKKIKDDSNIDLSSYEKFGRDDESEFLALEARLLFEAEKAKIELSGNDSASIDISNMFEYDGKMYNLSFTISLSDFDNAVMPLYDKIKGVIKKCLSDRNFTPADIDRVILVGGSSNNTYIKKIVKSVFGFDAYADGDLSTMVVTGATLIANNDDSLKDGLQINDLISHSLGIEILGSSGNFELEKILMKNDKYPCSGEKIFTTIRDNQKEVKVSIFEGDITEDIELNEFYGEFILDNIEDARAGVPQIKVVFDFDQSRILTVTAIDLITNNKKIIKVSKMDKNERIRDLDSVLMLRTGESANLSKLGFNLSKLTTVLDWDANEGSGSSFDLDSSIITLNNNSILETISYTHLKNSNSSIIHNGDNLTGYGDAETIEIDLTNLPQNVNRLIFIVNIYNCESNNQHFGMIKNSSVLLVNSENQKELLKYNITEQNYGKTAMFISEIKKENNMWLFKALGKSNNYKSISELERNISDIN